MGLIDSDGGWSVRAQNEYLANWKNGDYVVFWVDTSCTDNVVYEPRRIGTIVQCKKAKSGFLAHSDAEIRIHDIIDEKDYTIYGSPHKDHYYCKGASYGLLEKVDKIKLMGVLAQRKRIEEDNGKLIELHKKESERILREEKERKKKSDEINNDVIEEFAQSIRKRK